MISVESEAISNMIHAEIASVNKTQVLSPGTYELILWLIWRAIVYSNSCFIHQEKTTIVVCVKVS